MSKKLVVIGNGMAGVAAIEAILKKNADVAITLFGDEPHPNYNRIYLSDVLAGKTSPSKIVLNTIEWYQQNKIDLRLGLPVAQIDTQTHQVMDAQGGATHYDVLILAVGGLPFVPPIPGADKNGVHVFRTLDETDAIVTAARSCGHAVVVGGGLLGLEAARGLINYGVSVTVVHLADRLMELQLDPIGGAILKREIERMGIRVILNTTSAEILGDGTVTAVRLSNGETLTAEMALITTGIRPNTALARQAGIPCNRGVIVDDQMQTGVSDIFAVGDVVEHRGRTYGLVAPLRDQAGVVAEAIAGDGKRRYQGTVCATTLKVAGINLTSAGDFIAEAGAEEIAFADTQKALYKKCVLRQGRLTGFILLGDNKDGTRLFNLLQKGEDVTAIRSGLISELSGGGSATSTGAIDPLSGTMALPDTDTICNCNSVTKGAILCAIKEKNLKTREEVATCTQATTGCGSCAQLVDDLLVGVLRKPVAAQVLPMAQVTASHPPQMEQKATSLKTLDLEKVKQAGLGIDFQKLREAGTRALEMEDYYRLKTYGFCSQKHSGYFMLRVRIPGGRLSHPQMRFLARITEQHGRGFGHLTVRQSLELHFVRIEDALDIMAALEENGLTNRSACGHTLRNVMACPHGDIAEDGLLDVRPWAAAITDYFVRRSDLINPTMPNRLNLYFAGCDDCATEAVLNDIAFVATKRLADDGREETGFSIFLGGSLGAHPILGWQQRDFIPMDEVLPACQAVFEIHTRFGNRNKAKSRLKFLIEQWGRERFSKTFERIFEDKKNLPENRLVPLPGRGWVESGPPPPRRVTQRVVSLFNGGRSAPPPDGTVRQRQSGYVRLQIDVPLGEIRSRQLRAVGSISERFGNGEVHFTRHQNIELHWIAERNVERVAAILKRVGLFPKGAAKRLNLLACPGTEFCVLAVTNAQAAAKDLLNQYHVSDAEKQALFQSLSIHISGCPNSCAKHQVGDIGLAGTLLPVGDDRLFSYQLFLGGTLEGEVQLGEMVRKGITEAMVIPTIDALLDLIVEQREPGETFRQTVLRLSPKKVAALLAERLAPFVPQEIIPLAMDLNLVAV